MRLMILFTPTIGRQIGVTFQLLFYCASFIIFYKTFPRINKLYIARYNFYKYDFTEYLFK